MKLAEYRKSSLESELSGCYAQLKVLEQECEDLKTARDAIEQYIVDYEVVIKTKAGEFIELLDSEHWKGDQRDKFKNYIGDAGEQGANKLKAHMESSWDSLDNLLSNKRSQCWALYARINEINRDLNAIEIWVDDEE